MFSNNFFQFLSIMINNLDVFHIIPVLLTRWFFNINKIQFSIYIFLSIFTLLIQLITYIYTLQITRKQETSCGL